MSEDCGKFVDCEKTTKQKYRKPDKNKVSGFFLFLSGFEPLAFRLGELYLPAGKTSPDAYSFFLSPCAVFLSFLKSCIYVAGVAARRLSSKLPLQFQITMLSPYLSSTPPEIQELCSCGNTFRRLAACQIHGNFTPPWFSPSCVQKSHYTAMLHRPPAASRPFTDASAPSEDFVAFTPDLLRITGSYLKNVYSVFKVPARTCSSLQD